MGLNYIKTQEFNTGPMFVANKEHGKIAMFFICIFGIMPFVYAGNLLDPVEIPSLIAGFIIVSVLLIIQNRTVYHFTKVDLLWALLILAYLQSLLVCKDSANVLFETIKCIFAYLLFIAFRLTLKNERVFVQAGLVVSIVASLQVVIVIVQKYIGLDLYDSTSKFFGTMTNKNILAEFALFSFSLIFYSLYKIKAGNNKASLVMVAGIISTLFLITTLKSRSVWVGFVGAVVVVHAMFIKFHRKQFIDFVGLHKKKIIVSTLFLIVAFTVYFIVDFKDFFKHIIDLFQGNSEGRISIWLKTLPIIYDNFWQGVGAGNFRYYLGKMEGEFKTRPHNDYLWVFSETGIVGIIAYVAIIGAAGYLLYRNIQSGKGDALLINYAALFSLVAYCIDSFFAFPKERPYNLVFLAFFIAISFAYASVQKPLVKINSVVKTVSIIVISVIALVFCFYRYDGESKLKKIIYGAHLQPFERLQILRSIKTWAYKTDPLSVPVKYYEGLALLETGDYNEAKRALISASELYPFQPDVLLNAGTVCEYTGDRERAKDFYSKAIVSDTLDYRPVLNLAILEYKDKQFTKCAELLSKLDTIALRKDTLQYRQYRVLKSSVVSFYKNYEQ